MSHRARNPMFEEFIAPQVEIVRSRPATPVAMESSVRMQLSEGIGSEASEGFEVRTDHRIGTDLAHQ